MRYMRNRVCASIFFALSSLWSGVPRRLCRPKENSKQKKRDAHTQLYMLRESGLLRSALITAHSLAHVDAARTPGSLRSVLVTALDLAHVHAAPANSALFLPDVSLFASDFFWGGEAPPPCLLRCSPSEPGSWQRAETRALKSVPRCGACVLPAHCNVCALSLCLSLNRARRGGAGDALARALVRAASLTAGARSCASFFVKQMTGSQCGRGKLSCWCPQAYKLLRQNFNQLYMGESSQIGFRQTDGQTDTQLLNHQPTPITTIRSPRLLNKLNVSPRDTQTSVCVM